ncbi:MAG: hypothetical protein V8Q43_05125 [Christensenellaceae bacterium]
MLYRGISTGEFEKARAYEVVIDAVRTALSAEYEPTEKAIENYYETYLSMQKTYAEGDLSYYDYYTSESVNLYMPAGFRYVKNLLIAIPDDVRDEIAALRKEGKEDEADELRDRELAKIEEKAQQVYARIQNGESYEALLAEFGEDPGMKEAQRMRKQVTAFMQGLPPMRRILKRLLRLWKNRAIFLSRLLRIMATISSSIREIL